MTKNQKLKKFDLEERTFNFAKNCRILVKKILKTIINIEDGKQLIRSSGSVHSNYIEANESLSKTDFYHRIKICRKEAKESRSWLKFLDVENNQELILLRDKLINEAEELMKIFGSIITKANK